MDENIYKPFTERNAQEWWMHFIEIKKTDGTVEQGRFTEWYDDDEIEGEKACIGLNIANQIGAVVHVEFDEIVGARHIPRMWTSSWEK